MPTPELAGGEDAAAKSTSKIFSQETQLKQGRRSKMKSLHNDPMRQSKLKETFQAYD